MLNTVQATFPSASFDPNSIATSCVSGAESGIEGAQCAWFQAHQLFQQADTGNVFSTVSPALQRFSRIAQDVMSGTASNYDISKLCLGLLITGAAAALVLPAICKDCTRSTYTGVFLAFMIGGYGSMMFASSYVEEEQQFWYWICSGWLLYLHVRSGTTTWSSRGTVRSSNTWAKLGTLGLAVSQRLIRRWNQTGQKFAAEPDIARTFFPSNPTVMWALVILTYADSGYHLLRSLPSSVLPRLGALVLAVVALMFKLNFVASDSPELLVNTFLSNIVGKGLIDWSLVWQARIVFGGVAFCALLAIFTKNRPQALRGKTERCVSLWSQAKLTALTASHTLIHEALHLFLMTQSRATNIPLFLLFRIQAVILSSMNLNGIEVTVTMLILQYMTFFAFGGSNAISSVDLSSAYNGIGSYSVVLVGLLTFVSNWAGPVWWVSMSHLMQPYGASEHHSPAALLTFHIATSVVSVMAACTALRTHLFIWTVFSPKYLYTMAWATANHVAVNLLGGLGFSFLQSRE